jgi:hypothetical protein
MTMRAAETVTSDGELVLLSAKYIFYYTPCYIIDPIAATIPQISPTYNCIAFETPPSSCLPPASIPRVLRSPTWTQHTRLPATLPRKSPQKRHKQTNKMTLPQCMCQRHTSDLFGITDTRQRQAHPLGASTLSVRSHPHLGSSRY